MVALQQEPSPALPTRIGLLSIAGFWGFYFLIVSIRALMFDFEDQLAMIYRRLVVVVLSAGITYLFYLVLRQQAMKSLKRSILVAGALAIPASAAYSTINYFAFRDIDAKIFAADAMKKVVVIDGSGKSGQAVRIINSQRKVEIRHAPPQPAATPLPPETAGAGEAPVPPSPPAPPAPPVLQPSDSISIQVGDIGSEQKMSPASFKIADHTANSYFFFVAWAALYLALCYAHQARTLERRAARLSAAAQAAELKALRYQVNPHFLFNTLNSLSSLIMKSKPSEAEQMILNLSNFFRTSLTADPTEDITLEEEIRLQCLYLDIEAVRFPGRLKTDIVIPDALASACVPALILQPLVENAVKYGVSRTKEPVTIHIHAREDSHGLVLCVENDGPVGPGLRDERDASTHETENGMGVGLRNVQDRLNARFGNEADCRWGHMPQGGFSVTLYLPIIRHGC